MFKRGILELVHSTCRRAHLSGEMQRREARLRLGAHERAVLEQQRAHLLVALLGRHVQRRLAVLGKNVLRSSFSDQLIVNQVIAIGIRTSSNTSTRAWHLRRLCTTCTWPSSHANSSGDQPFCHRSVHSVQPMHSARRTQMKSGTSMILCTHVPELLYISTQLHVLYIVQTTLQYVCSSGVEWRECTPWPAC